MIKFKMFGFGTSATTAPPLSPETASQGALAATAEAQTNPEGKRVLIVDDDSVFLTATALKLRSAGLQVRTAKEGSEAIAALGEEPADAILMDINFQPDVCNGGMGSWDGFQLTTWLRGNPGASGARFIIVSNSDSPSHRQRAQQVGAVAYFQKPVDHDRLIAAVNGGN
jgi:two-component system, chemotaxis family, sensor histidine kinase and response regulator PixL